MSDPYYQSLSDQENIDDDDGPLATATVGRDPMDVILADDTASDPEPVSVVADPTTAVATAPRVSVNMPPEILEQHFIQDREYEAEELMTYQWHITNWQNLEQRVTSPEFQCGGHTWRILLFPFGNNHQEYISAYLELVKDKEESPDWHVCAQFCLFISNTTVPTLYHKNYAQHRFNNEESDWGFTKFIQLREVAYSAYPEERPILDNGAATITVLLRILKDPTGMLWHNFKGYDSKKETGYVGLNNQGATCYMNSLLQSLFFTNYLRRAVYQIPTADDKPTSSVALALQRLFYNLQTSDQPVDTTELTKSFGWNTLDSFMQHDVQEFNRVLQDNLEGKMKGTASEGAIDRLFLGKMTSFVRCINVDFESSRMDNYYDIQLNVKGCKTLRDSFAQYVAEETLDGENKYMAEGHGLQDAKKGDRFDTFPSVLHLQLKRFEYDMMRDAMVKINDRHEFPLEIDLEEFLATNADRSVPCRYILHGVLVHSGDVHSGHYFALLRPEKNGKWFKFDDDRVIPVTEKEVLEDNFGGEANSTLSTMGGMRPVPRLLKRFTNAYMLVYIRESELDTVLAPVKASDIPEHLVKQIEEERAQREAEEKEAEEKLHSMNIALVDDHIMKQHHGFDLVNFSSQNWPLSPVEMLRVRKDSSYANLVKLIEEKFELKDPNSYRLWVFVNRQNRTTRPDIVLPSIQPETPIESMKEIIGLRGLEVRLYVERAGQLVDGEPFPAVTAKPVPSPHILLFVKYYDPRTSTIEYVGKVYATLSNKIETIVPLLREMKGIPSTTPITLYEEVKPSMVDELSRNKTFREAELQNGDIICFQVDLTPQERKSPDITLPTVKSYFFNVQKSITIIFRPKPKTDAEALPTVELQLQRDMKYDQVAECLARRINVDPMRLQFTPPGKVATLATAIRRDPDMFLEDMLSYYYVPNKPGCLYYDVLDMDITEYDSKRRIKVTWTGLNNSQSTDYILWVMVDGTVHDLVQALLDVVELTETGTGKVRMIQVLDNKINECLSEDTPLERVQSNLAIVAEEIPEDEVELLEGETIISVVHFNKEASRTHGLPFVCRISATDTVGELRQRLFKRSGMSEKEFEKVRLALLGPFVYTKPEYLEDDDVQLESLNLREGMMIGLDHVDKSGRSAGRFAERAIKIFN
ncbi:cysteine proteinase [Syncephalis plumigaleata]|nr:cysteine proteinase [Syncephalis plumigaleata]